MGDKDIIAPAQTDLWKHICREFHLVTESDIVLRFHDDRYIIECQETTSIPV